MKRSEAKEIRRQMEKAASRVDDETALDIVTLFPAWKVGTTYALDDRVRYQGHLYRCVQAHTAQAGWNPVAAQSLWVPVSVEEYPEWIQPIGSHDAYRTDDKVTHAGRRWRSAIDANVWEPGTPGTENMWIDIA